MRDSEDSVMAHVDLMRIRTGLPAEIRHDEGMELNVLHRWDVSLHEAEHLQRQLRKRLVLTPPPNFAPRLVAGADVSTVKDSPVVYAGIVILEMPTLQVVTQATAVSEATFPYIPGFLSFRELPALAEAWKVLQVLPDVLVLDGQGTAHPRGMGIACHAGLLFSLPTIGCAKSILVGKHAQLGAERGAMAPLIYRNDVVGMAVRTRTGVSPVYVSPGDRMDSQTAVALVLSLTPDGRYRLPETTRHAHRLVNDIRRAHQAKSA